MKVLAIILVLTRTFAKGERLGWVDTTPSHVSYKDIGPPPNPLPVYLSPYSMDGLTDPVTGLKAPLDLLAMSMYRPRTEKEKRRLLMTRPLSTIQFYASPSPPAIFYNPSDKMLPSMQNGTKGDQEPMWYNYEALQDQNLNKSPYDREPIYRYQVYRSKRIQEMEEARNIQLAHTETESEKRNYSLNWTTCEEFKKKSIFHPKYLVDIVWLTFYTWTIKIDMVAQIYKFRSATRKMVARIKTDLGDRLSREVDWNQFKLVMETDHSASLLIAADRSGLFHQIKDEALSEFFIRNRQLKFPVKLIALKIVNQYVAMMDCEAHYATIMAPIEDAPRTDADKEKAAKLLKFKGKGLPVSRDLMTEAMDAEAALMANAQKDELIVPKDEGVMEENEPQLEPSS